MLSYPIEDSLHLDEEFPWFGRVASDASVTESNTPRAFFLRRLIILLNNLCSVGGFYARTNKDERVSISKASE
jgi:hypothetical protein